MNKFKIRIWDCYLNWHLDISQLKVICQQKYVCLEFELKFSVRNVCLNQLNQKILWFNALTIDIEMFKDRLSIKICICKVYWSKGDIVLISKSAFYFSIKYFQLIADLRTFTFVEPIKYHLDLFNDRPISFTNNFYLFRLVISSFYDLPNCNLDSEHIDLDIEKQKRQAVLEISDQTLMLFHLDKLLMADGFINYQFLLVLDDRWWNRDFDYGKQNNRALDFYLLRNVFQSWFAHSY